MKLKIECPCGSVICMEHPDHDEFEKFFGMEIYWWKRRHNHCSACPESPQQLEEQNPNPVINQMVPDTAYDKEPWP